MDEEADLLEELLAGDYLVGTPDFFDFPIDENEDNNEINNQNMLTLARSPSESALEARLFHALSFIKQSQLDSQVLIQIWAPVRSGSRQFLTTLGQPFWLDPNCQSLSSYRSVSLSYQFSAGGQGPGEVPGLPGRVFLEGVPEWTPDVRYFSSEEYPRVSQAQRYDVRGSIALPIFERGSRACVGVVEVVSTSQKVNYRSDVENICSALQAVDLMSSDAWGAPCVKETNDSYQDALPEIFNMLKSVCQTHGLPLAQTWIPCIQQGKQGSRHTEENYRNCVSTIDDASFVNDPSVLGFHEACSEHHLFKNQGVVGKAFTTNQPCFSHDITSFIKTEYPLSHHAKLFGLRAAVAIRLRSIYSGNTDFVLEFFLPRNCVESEEQKMVLNSLSVTIQKLCQSLRVVTAMELEEEKLPSDFLYDNVSEGNIGKVKVPLEFGKQEAEEFSVTTSWDPPKEMLPEERASLEISQLWQDSGNDTNELRDSVSTETSFMKPGKTTEKRRAKMEKTVSLQVLRQHFAGSLKDAAKNLGVCPTTLKRICRQHGITRWPSRKIKKVGHSLQKLQVVIDSVRGAQGTFQFSSLYENLTTAPTFSPLKPSIPLESSKEPQQDENVSHSHSHTSSFSHSSSSSHEGNVKHEERKSSKLKRTRSNIEIQFSNPGPPESLVRSISHENLGDTRALRKRTVSLKVKAVYGEEKIRFRLQPEWGFQELKKEIAKRFGTGDWNLFHLKYLDDDSEWVLLTCDADLEECIDVYKMSTTDTIRISVHRVAVSDTRGLS